MNTLVVLTKAYHFAAQKHVDQRRKGDCIMEHGRDHDIQQVVSGCRGVNPWLEVEFDKAAAAV